MHSSSGDAVGVELNTVPFRILLRALRTLPGVKMGKAGQNWIDDAVAPFEYKGLRFEVHTPLSDYWINRPADCPSEIFQEIVRHLERFPVRWWHRIP